MKITRETHCHSIPSSTLPNPAGRVCRSACMCGNASSVNSDENRSVDVHLPNNGWGGGDDPGQCAPSTTSRTATPVMLYFRSRSKGTVRTQTGPPRLCPINYIRYQRNPREQDGIGRLTRSEGHAAGSGNTAVKRLTKSPTSVIISRFASTSGVRHSWIGAVFPVKWDLRKVL